MIHLCKIFFSRGLIRFSVSPYRRIILQEYYIRLDPCLGIKIFQPICQICVMIDKSELIKIPVRIGNGSGDRCALSARHGDFRILGRAAGEELVKEPYDDNEQDYERKAAGASSSAGTAPAGETPVEYRPAPSSARTTEMRPARTSASAESASGASAKRPPSEMTASAV